MLPPRLLQREHRQAEATDSLVRPFSRELDLSHRDGRDLHALPMQEHPGFAALLERIRSNGVRTIIVETANRFARDLIVQETGHRMLKAQGIEIIAADSPGAFVEDTPTATLVHQVLGAVAQFDKAMTVAKLRLARDRIRKRDGKCEGRKSHAEERPEAVALARQLHKQGMTYRAIGAELERAGHVNERCKPFHHKSVRAMLAG
jgi:DNA invertase Pin-like site-specific DNA recombinase